VPALPALVENSTQGDPMGSLIWTTKSLRRLANELAAQGRKVGRDTVAALLKAAGLSLRGNAACSARARVAACPRCLSSRGWGGGAGGPCGRQGAV
jgi:hypothetical protein